MNAVDAILAASGFRYINNLAVYQICEHERYGANVVEVKICNGTAQVFVTDYTHEWCVKNAAKAFKALAKAK